MTGFIRRSFDRPVQTNPLPAANTKKPSSVDYAKPFPHSVIDSAALDAIREIVGDDDPTMFNEIIDTYLKESPPLLAAMRSAISQNNAEELTRAAHSLKSSSEYLGAIELVELCKKIEQIGRSNQVQDQTETAALIEQTEAHYALVAVALKQERNAA